VEDDHDMPVLTINGSADTINDNDLETVQCDWPDASMVEARLRKFRHLLENIYKPALIIGCVLSTTLCVFFRVVVLGCGHSHLRRI